MNKNRSKAIIHSKPQNGLLLIQETVSQLETIRRFIATALTKDVDYGQIPGIDKKFLLQPGAEKIAMWLRARPQYETNEEKLENGHFDVVARCKMVSIQNRAELAESPWCSCSSMESNFRFRWVRPVCTVCAGQKQNPPCTACKGSGYKVPSKEESARMKTLDQGRWIPEKKGDVVVGWQWKERWENPNIFDERNKVRQMACKRAFVKAIRTMGALSEIFTEDPAEWHFTDVIEAELVEVAEDPKPQGRVVMAEEPTDIWPARKPDGNKMG